MPHSSQGSGFDGSNFNSLAQYNNGGTANAANIGNIGSIAAPTLQGGAPVFDLSAPAGFQQPGVGSNNPANQGIGFDWGKFNDAFGAFNSLAQAFLGYKSYKLSKKQFNFGKDVTLANFSRQETAFDNFSADQQTARNAARSNRGQDPVSSTFVQDRGFKDKFSSQFAPGSG